MIVLSCCNTSELRFVNLRMDVLNDMKIYDVSKVLKVNKFVCIKCIYIKCSF